MKKVTIYSDGGCSPNPGNGGYGALLMMGDIKREIWGGEPASTNNRMELMSAIVALKQLKYPCEVEVISDSQYLIQGASTWIDGWRKKGWKDVKNLDLWAEIDKLLKIHKIKWTWVRGHNGNIYNALVDALATKARLQVEETPEKFHVIGELQESL